MVYSHTMLARRVWRAVFLAVTLALAASGFVACRTPATPPDSATSTAKPSLEPTAEPTAGLASEPVILGPYAGKIGVGLEGVGGRGLEFVDAAKTLRPWEAIGGGPVAVDAYGWPLADARTVFFDLRPTFAWAPPIDDPDAFQIDVSGTYRLSFTGKAVIEPAADDPGAMTFVVENQIYDEETNVTTADIVLQPGKGLLIVNFLETEGGVRDVKLIRPGYPADTEQIFHTPFLEALKPFSVLRFMDWLATNNTDPPYEAEDNTIEWDERRLPTDATQLTWEEAGKHGVAWEYVIALGNQAGKDIWINIPAAASDDYVRQLATLLKETLDPNLKIYIEHSNEVWNPLFSAWDYNRKAAEAEVAAGDSPLNDDGATNLNTLAQRRHAKRSVDFAAIFGEVFGADAINDRIRVVLSWRVGDPNAYREQLGWISQTYGPPDQFIYAIAGAPYFSSHGADSDASVDEILATMRKSSNASRRDREALQAVADEYSLKHFCYEGGPDSGGGDPTNVANRIRAHRDPRMKDLILYDLYNNWFSIGGDLFAYFTLSSAYSRYGMWGLTDDITDLQTPKFRAIYDLLGLTASAPPTPADIEATVDDGQVTLAWSESFGAASYTVTRGEKPRGSREAVATGVATTTFTDTGLTNGKTYWYTIYAVNEEGESEASLPFKAIPKPLSDQPIYAANLLLNPEFDNGVDGWSMYVNEEASARVSIDTAGVLSGENAIRYEIEKGGSWDWHVMLFQRLPIYAGNTYEISFMAVTNSDLPVPIILKFEEGGEPWTTYWQQEVGLSYMPTVHGPFTFQCLDDDEEVNFMFRMGTNEGMTIWFDAVTVRQVGGDTVQGVIEKERVAEARMAQIRQTTQPPAIDGKIDETWAQAVAFPIANNNLGMIDSADDLYGTFKALWDAENLYVLIEVVDDALVNDSQDTHQDDAAEIFIDADHSGGLGYDLHDAQYKFGWGDTQVDGVYPRTKGVVFAQVDTGTGYLMEVLIPWSSLNTTVEAGQTIGLEVMLNDDDDGDFREGKLAWWAVDNDDAWNNPSVFGTAILVGAEED